MPSPRSVRSRVSDSDSKPKTKRAPRRRAAQPKIPALPVIPLRGMVAFPSMVLPLFIGREPSINAIEFSANGDKMLFLVTQRDEENEDPKSEDLYETGIVAEIMQWVKLPDGNLRVIVEGRSRAVAQNYIAGDYLAAMVEPIEAATAPDTAQSEALSRRLRDDFESALNLSKRIPPEAMSNISDADDLGALADLVVSYLETSVEDRQNVLEQRDVMQRAQTVVELLHRELQVLEIDREIEAQVKEGVGDNQREYFLRERLRTIQDKLSEADPNYKEGEGLRGRIEAAGMPEEAKEESALRVGTVGAHAANCARSRHDSQLYRADVRFAVGQRFGRYFGFETRGGDFG